MYDEGERVDWLERLSLKTRAEKIKIQDRQFPALPAWHVISLQTGGRIAGEQAYTNKL